uniref:Sensor protein fixL n=1 Tax=Lygus hesperus TaxID=30085 RepID=A0A0A9Y8U7_LYGHE
MRLTPLRLPSNGYTVFVAAFELLGDTRRLFMTEELNNISSEMNTDGIIVVNSNVIIVSINNAAASLFGYEPNDLLYKRLSMLLTPDEGVYYERYFSYRSSSNFAERNNLKKMVSGVHSDGSTFTFRMCMSDIPTPSGQTQFVLCVENITPEREAEDAAALCVTLMKISPVPHVLCSKSGNVIRISHAAG